MSLYITTSRKPSKLTRRLAKTLALVLGAEYENRGKRSVQEIEERAKEKGLERILFIHEKQGNPDKIVFLQENWLEPEVLIKGVNMPLERKRVKNPEIVKVVCLDSDGEKLKQLLNASESENASVLMTLSEKEIVFKQGEETILGIKISLK